MDYITLTPDVLSVGSIYNLAVSADCGAVSLFVGTTRDNFDGKAVVNLEYEAYEDMARKVLNKICQDLRSKWPHIVNVAIFHRLGTVPVTEASIVIAISSPHREDALAATQWCINTVKSTVPIWKKEVYEDEASSVWKENKESLPSSPQTCDKLDLKQEVIVPNTPLHFIQVKGTTAEIDERIENFIQRKRNEISKCNIRDFCQRTIIDDTENTCARVDSVLVKRKDSKGHLQVDRVYNTYSRDQSNMEYLTKHIPKNGIEERVLSLETQLSLTTPVPRNIYVRLQEIENRLLHLESISPEYIQFWERTIINKPSKRKRIFSVHEIDNLIMDLENKQFLVQ